MPDGSRRDVSKLFVIPHCNAVVAARGCMFFFERTHSFLTAMSSEFDDLVWVMPSIIRSAVGDVIRHSGRLGIPKDQANAGQIVLAGYSKRSSRVMIHNFQYQPETGHVETRSDIDSIVSPWLDGAIETGDIETTPDGLIKLTKRQAKVLREQMPGAAAGGRIVLVVVEAHRISIDSSEAIWP